MRNRLTWSSRSHRGYTDLFVLIYSFGSRLCLLLCSHTQEAVAVSGHSEPDLGQVVCSLDNALLSRTRCNKRWAQLSYAPFNQGRVSLTLS